MTEYELIDAAATMQNMSQSIYEFGIAVLTGYILLAYYIGGQDPLLPIVPIISVLIPIAALAFMWRVRHPKTE